jgi:hypothetical protein
VTIKCEFLRLPCLLGDGEASIPFALIKHMLKILKSQAVSFRPILGDEL